jgi:hypothetical protein
MEIRTVLLPTDFSPWAEQACQQGFALAAREHAHVLLVHVLYSGSNSWRTLNSLYPTTRV